MPALRNRAKERLLKGEPIGGFGVTMAAPPVAQILAASGADFITVDLEHGAIDLAAVHSLIAATSGTDCVPSVRVPAGQTAAIKPALDAGALGIVFPMVRTREDVEAGIRATLYPPAGARGIGHHFAPARWGVSAAEYLAGANDAIMRMALIETKEALANIRDLLSVPGLEVATVAPGDLAASLGYPGQPGHPDVQAAIRSIESAVAESKVALGGVASSAVDATKKIQSGYRVIVLAFDVGLVQEAAKPLVSAVRK